MNKPAVQLKQVSKKIGDKTIIDKLSLQIYPGEVFGFLGPNGAGKTTTIRMMVGLMSMSEGDIVIHGKSIKHDFQTAIRDVGAIVENPELYNYLSGYKNLVHFANMTPGVTRERINEIVRLVGLEKRIHDKVQTYSLGMKQRLGLAQALLHKPSVLILDEPTNGLDPAGIREMREYLRLLAKQEKTAIVVSSHLLAEMEMMCDRFAVIQEGKLIDVREKAWFIQERQDQKSVHRFRVEQKDKAYAKLTETFPEIGFQMENGEIKLEEIPDTVAGINTWLVKNGFKVYAIHQDVKTLEDRFLEITGGK